MRVAAIALYLALGACGAPIAVLYAIEAAASSATLANDVLNIDTSLAQSRPDKTKLVP